MSVDDVSCPKHMVYGPCGGVRADLSCEMDRRPCPFAARQAAVAWPSPVTRPQPSSALLDAIDAGPVVLTDFSVPAYDAEAVAAVTEVLRDSCDAVLVGEHQDSPDFPPSLMSQLIRSSGGTPWVTLTCRDRNRVVLDQELAGLRLAGADGVLCVTGDGRAPGVRADVTQVFDLDGTRLAAVAASYGLAVGVPESPETPPRELRPGRLLTKQRAGARLAVLNHVSSIEAVRTFVESARTIGVTLPVVAAVAVFTDAPSAAVLRRFPGLHLDEDRTVRVTQAADPETAGIESAVEEAEHLLSIEGVAGVNLSGSASSRGELASAEIKAEIGRRIRSSA